MKKYLVIGKPIKHSLSPEIHNFWLEKYNIKGIYEKMEINQEGLIKLILKVKKREINGINVTVPFKKEIIPLVDQLSLEAEITQSVNTICLKDNKIMGYNTDIDGFNLAMHDTTFDFNNKKILILGAGGVVPSIIYALNKMKVSEIMVSNRTQKKAEELKNIFKDLKIVTWGEFSNVDMIINATSLGLDNNDEIKIDFSQIENNKFFYDVIYNPKETKFLKNAQKLGHKTENGKKMFIYQAAKAFQIWHGIQPKIEDQVIKLLDK